MTLIDIIVANGLGALLSDYVINLPAKPVLLTGGIALMLAVQLAFSPAIGYWPYSTRSPTRSHCYHDSVSAVVAVFVTRSGATS